MTEGFELTKEQQKIIDGLESDKEKKFVIQCYRQEYEWNHSLDGISYELGALAVSDSMECCILRVVQKLPDKVRQFVYENCQFTAVEENGGQTVCMNTKQNRARPWLIILSEEKLDDYESVIAHELAHAWLRHKDAPGIERAETGKPKEISACLHAKLWGFVGSGIELSKSFEKIEKLMKGKPISNSGP